MARGGFNLHTGGVALFDIHSGGRAQPLERLRLSQSQIDAVGRTVRRTPEVMAKVTGGAKTIRAAAAHLSYISQEGEIELETDEGEHIQTKAGQKELLEDWHLELSSGQYRNSGDSQRPGRSVKLVHNIVLSIPAPTPPDKVLAAAKKFAREKFALKHRYVMALHAHQRHPHVHLVVKAEDNQGRRLHIDKVMLRAWREDFARMMREQGIAANATPRVLRGQTKRAGKDVMVYAHRRTRERVESVVNELQRTGTVRDPARAKLLETRKAVLAGWEGIAQALDKQGQVILAGDVRYFASHLAPVRTDRERIAEDFIRHR